MRIVRVLAGSLLFTGLTLFGSSCAHHRDVRPGADGINHVIVRATDRTEAEQSAISQAENYCDQFQKHPGFLEEKSHYTGTMDEATRDNVRKASHAAILLGGTGSVIGSDDVRTGGNVLGAAGTVGSVMTGGSDYQSVMRFKCQ